MSANPFSDVYATPEGGDSASSYEQHENKINTMTLIWPETFPITFVHAIPSKCPGSRFSPDSSPSTTPSTPPLASLSYGTVEWTNANLNYLLSVLYPDQALANEFFFVPSLETLSQSDFTTPAGLALYQRLPVTPAPRSAYAATAPIGTGRPKPTTDLLATSRLSTTAASARQSLAARLIGDKSILNFMAAYYNLLAQLYVLPQPLLDSVHRGLKGMAQTSEPEWYARFVALRDAGVDGSWGFEAQLEAFVLEAGFSELGRWMVVVENVRGLVREEREEWARIYFETGLFLERVRREL
ncbi:hypothetical protein K458DRAFT_400933 [Lentithecium fluviatile CBS 122367]|uniref:Uncharacterized protein n=1 Tax=Lentithecium fluviatile CBS 122367 TaxID=1168545 RepID=A0A6G1JEE1_9PLEO|nr:hypothetical protein K458DRAFT_400933 [Lentithecium fluviatile CBS 122367]